MVRKGPRAKAPQKESVATYNPLDEDYLRRMFINFDKDQSGYLEQGECVAALKTIGSPLNFEDLDQDGDKRISFEEFMVCY